MMRHGLNLRPSGRGARQRGDPWPGGKRELYDAGHEAAPAWTEPPGRVLSPADMAAVTRALEEAAAYRRDRAAAWCDDCAGSPAEACEAHLDDLDAADAYDRLAATLRAAEEETDDELG